MVASGSDHSAHILSDHIASVRAQQRGHLERLVLTEARLKAMLETIQALPADMLDSVQPEVQKLFAQMEGSLREREILQREAFSQARRPSALHRATHATHATTDRPRRASACLPACHATHERRPQDLKEITTQMAIEIASLRSEWCQKFEAMLKASNARFDASDARHDASDARHERSGAELHGRGSKGRAPSGIAPRLWPSDQLAPHQATISSSTPGTRSLIWPHMHVVGRACAVSSRRSLACSRRRSASASRPARRLAAL